MSIRTIALAEVGYLAPRQVLVGPGASHDVGAALRSWGLGAGRVFLVADRVVSEMGLFDPVIADLTKAGFVAELFDEIAGEPDDIMAGRAVEQARSTDPAAVIGIGGGSALDVAKLVALLVRNEGTVRDWLGVIEPPVPAAPLVLMPTTTGTGSEATRISMITVDGAKRFVSCAQFVPMVAVLDETLVAGLPAGVVASTGMDAVAHGVESILSTNRSSFTIAVATQAIQILVAELEKATRPEDTVAKGKILYGAHLAGLALNASVVLGHSLAYVIARHAPMPHGTSCALALPYCLAYNDDTDPVLVAHLARTLTGNASTSLQSAAEAVDALNERLALPRSLADVGISEEEIAQMASETVTDYPRPNNPVPLERAAIATLLGHMHRGDLAGCWTTESKGNGG